MKPSLYDGSTLKTKAAQSGSAQSTVASSIAANTAMDTAIGTLLNNDATITSALTTSVGDVVNVLGAKNLLPMTGQSTVYNGVTYSVSDDGIVTLSGTTTTGSSFNFAANLKVPDSWKGNKVTFSGTKDIVFSGAYCLLIVYDSSNNNLVQFDLNNSNKVFESKVIPSNADHYVLQLQLNGANKAVSGTFKPMVCLESAYANDPTFVPYAMTNRELTEDLLSIGSIVQLANGVYGQTQFDIPSQYRTNKYQFEATIIVTVDNYDHRFSLHVSGDGIVSPSKDVTFVLGGYATSQYNCYAELTVKSTGKAYLNSMFINGTSYINAAQTYAVMRKVAL